MRKIMKDTPSQCKLSILLTARVAWINLCSIQDFREVGNDYSLLFFTLRDGLTPACFFVTPTTAFGGASP